MFSNVKETQYNFGKTALKIEKKFLNNFCSYMCMYWRAPCLVFMPKEHHVEATILYYYYRCSCYSSVPALLTFFLLLNNLSFVSLDNFAAKKAHSQKYSPLSIAWLRSDSTTQTTYSYIFLHLCAMSK